MYCYLHVPFCASHCIYCDFAVVLAKRPQAKRNPLGEAYIETQPYLKALCHEIDHRLASLPPGQALQTLYVGGGTPALMSARDYQTLFANLQRYVTLAPNAEITLEANPSHRASPPADYRAVGFNRISLGVQSFNNIELKRLSRTHTAGEGLTAIKQWQGAGFTNLSIDLMYGLPGQTVASWQHTLQIAVDTGVSHISLYGLKVEDATPLAKLQPYAAYTLPDEDLAATMFETTQTILSAAGYGQYEISNWAKPGHESRHNLNYWAYGDWLALGLGSHGHWQGQHYETTRDLATYLAAPLTVQCHDVTSQETLENVLILGLRRTEGLDIEALNQRFGIDFWQRYGKALQPFLRAGHLRWSPPKLCLSPAGMLLSNLILETFFDDAVTPG